MANTEGKNWWDQNLEWTIGGSKTGKLGSGLRSIPLVLGGRALAGETVQQESAKPAVTPKSPLSKVQSAPPKPPAPPRPVAPPAAAAKPAAAAPTTVAAKFAAAAPTTVAAKPASAAPIKAVNFPASKPASAAPDEHQEFTLEQLLDPNFCAYVRKDS